MIGVEVTRSVAVSSTVLAKRFNMSVCSRDLPQEHKIFFGGKTRMPPGPCCSRVGRGRGVDRYDLGHSGDVREDGVTEHEFEGLCQTSTIGGAHVGQLSPNFSYLFLTSFL